MERLNRVWFHLLIVLPWAILARSDDCIFSIFIRTEDMAAAETFAKIGLTLYDAGGDSLVVDDVVEWGGLMGPNHTYFQQGNLDLFSGRGECLSGPVCALNLTTDASGPQTGWYCNYVETNSIRLHADPTQQLFSVNEELSARLLYVYINNCASFGDAKSRDGRLKTSLSVI